MLLKRVKELKKEMKLTNEELASKAGIPTGTLNKILNGTTTEPKLPTVTALANALNCTIDYLAYEDVTDRHGEKKDTNSIDDDIFTKAAHKVGHEGPLTDEEKEDIALAIKIALARRKGSL